MAWEMPLAIATVSSRARLKANPPVSSNTMTVVEIGAPSTAAVTAPMPRMA